MIELELPYPPSVNHYYRHVGPRVLISREGRAYRETVCTALDALGIETMEGDLHIQIEIYPPDRRRRDIDNVQKALLDALQRRKNMQHGGAYLDDSQIVKLEIEKYEMIKGGQTLVRIQKYYRRQWSMRKWKKFGFFRIQQEKERRQ